MEPTLFELRVIRVRAHLADGYHRSATQALLVWGLFESTALPESSYLVLLPPQGFTTWFRAIPGDLALIPEEVRSLIHLSAYG